MNTDKFRVMSVTPPALTPLPPSLRLNLPKKGWMPYDNHPFGKIKSNELAFFASDESDDVVDGLKLLCFVIWNFHVEFLF